MHVEVKIDLCTWENCGVKELISLHLITITHSPKMMGFWLYDVMTQKTIYMATSAMLAIKRSSLHRIYDECVYHKVHTRWAPKHR